jgi:hypothetical protein
MMRLLVALWIVVGAHSGTALAQEAEAGRQQDEPRAVVAAEPGARAGECRPGMWLCTEPYSAVLSAGLVGFYRSNVAGDDAGGGGLSFELGETWNSVLWIGSAGYRGVLNVDLARGDLYAAFEGHVSVLIRLVTLGLGVGYRTGALWPSDGRNEVTAGGPSGHLLARLALPLHAESGFGHLAALHFMGRATLTYDVRSNTAFGSAIFGVEVSYDFSNGRSIVAPGASAAPEIW